MKKVKIFLLIFLSVHLGYTQELAIKPSNQRIEVFNNFNGFYQNSVNDIVSDSNGYLWIATPNGLVRYDGYTFEYYYHDDLNEDSLPDNNISNLLNDSKGRIWINTRGGLSVYLTDKEQFLLLKKDITNKTFIKEDARQRIWIGFGSKLFVYDASSENASNIDQLAEIELDEALDGNTMSDIVFLNDSELLVSTAFKIYKVRFDETRDYAIETSKVKSNLNAGVINKIVKNNSSIYVGTDSGLYHTFFENGKLVTVGTYLNSNTDTPTKKFQILSLYQDNEQNLWVGTKHSGVLKYDTRNDNFTSFQYDSKYKNRLSSNRINCFYEDDFGVLWIGTAQGGLNKFDKHQKNFQNYFHNPYDESSLSSNLITDITEDANGKIWLSFFDSTICRTLENSDFKIGDQVYFERLEKQLGTLNKEWVLRLYQDNRGFWWISTNKGLYLFAEDENRLIKIRFEAEGKLIIPAFNRVVDQISPNKILIGGNTIFMLHDPWAAILNNRPVKIEKKPFNKDDNGIINDYAVDSYDNYWFATTNGVLRLKYEDGKFAIKDHLTSTPGSDNLRLTQNRVFTIHIGKSKEVWLGTFGGGLMKIQLNASGEPKKIKSFSRKDGLRDEAIYGILEDNQALLWMSTDMGICRFDPEAELFNFYDVNDGVASNNFRQSAYLKTENGTILMGGVDGLTIFDPKKITINDIPPKVLITRLNINNQPIVSGKKYGGDVVLENSISDTKVLTLDHQNRNLSFDIIVQHSATPNKNTLAYKLEGVNKDWIEIDGGKATATYTNLSSGTYNFLYKGANGDGVWTKETDSFVIEILNPWYFRWWSIILWILSLLIITYAILRYFIGFEKLNQKLKFEQLDKERVHDMNQAKLRFFTNISHDFKTPLSLIVGPLEKIEERNKSIEDKKYFSIIRNNIARLQRLIDQLISYRKAETGHLELNYTKTTLGNFIYPMLEAFEDYAQRAGVNFYYKVKSPNKTIVLDKDNTERILLNLFSNAVKYTEFDREVSIKAGILGKGKLKYFFIEVANSSKGIPKDKIDKIFDRFYRGVDDHGSWRGTGIGLELCKTLTDLMNGTISVNSEANNKTVFKVELPCNKNLVVEEDKIKKESRNIALDWLPTEIDSDSIQIANKAFPRLLIIDDEKDARFFLFEAFKNKYNVTLAVNGEDGWEKLKEGMPQLIISDVMMPKLNGYEFCERVKSSIEFCNIPVILLTAMEDDAKKLKGYELGADDYIIKPFSIKHLEVRVAKLIENKRRVFEYFSRNSFIPKDSLITSIRDKGFLEKINISIEKNMSNSSFGVEELAADISMSTSNFYRRLKELTGQAPNLYLRNFRLQKAAELLNADKNLTAAEVMSEIGIESRSYYSATFKKIHGLSPSEYVKT